MLQLVSAGRAAIVPYVIAAQPVGHSAHSAVREDGHTTVSIVGADDPIVSAFPRPLEVNRVRWARGATCHVARVKGEFAGTIWIQRQRYLEDEVRCDFVLEDAARCVWDFDVYVEPRLRMGRTLARLWKAVDRQLADEGVAWSFSRISLFNPGSLQAHRRLGAVDVATALFFVAGRLELLVSNHPPFVHVGTGLRPEMRLHSPDRPSIR
jgi:hypothetical protein